MTTSTDGILCYGFDVLDGDGEPVDSFEWFHENFNGSGEGSLKHGIDENDFFAKVVGLKEPDEPYMKERFDTDPVFNKTWSDYWSRLHGLADELGVEIVTHCSGECPMYVLAAKESVQEARRGNPIYLGQEIVAKEEWKEKLRAFCAMAKIKYTDPEWVLCSYWG